MMSEDNCLPFRDNLATYALGALDAKEAEELEAHLAGCAHCQAELAAYRQIALGLLEAVPPRQPPRRLRSAVASRLPAARKRTPIWEAAFPRRLNWAGMLVAAVLVILLGAATWSFFQIHRLQQQQAVLAARLEAEGAAVAMLASPQTQVLAIQADIQNLTGSLLVDREQNTAVLILHNLPKPPPGKTYQIWLIDASGKRTSGGLFNPNEELSYTTAKVQPPTSLDQFVGLGVTIEPQGGSEGPTGPRVLGADL